MIPFAGFGYFGILLYIALPTFVLGLFRRANRHWLLLTSLVLLLVQFESKVRVSQHLKIHGYLFVLLWALFQAALCRCFLSARARGSSALLFYATLLASLLPLLAARVVPLFSSHFTFGFLGISYVTFRALDMIFCIQDRVIVGFSFTEYLVFLLFFPTLSSGPIDRFRRFRSDWLRVRTRSEFMADLDSGIHRTFRGFLYKFLIAALVDQHWLGAALRQPGLLGSLNYMYAYTAFLFFDFAGYSEFAIGVSYILGVHTPENFNKPFLARNIRDFWNRWHMSLSFWFRDHVYMRFVMAAMKGNWFKSKHTPALLGYYLSFGLMGLWHGFTWYYLVYGLYQGTLLSCFDIFTRWSKKRNLRLAGPAWNAASILLTFHFVAFGFLIFSGHLARPSQAPIPAAVVQQVGKPKT